VAVTFVTVAVVTVAFYVVIRAFGGIRVFMEDDVTESVDAIAANAGLGRMIVALEFEIQNMSVVFPGEAGELEEASRRTRLQLENIRWMLTGADGRRPAAMNQEFFDRFRDALDLLLDDFAALRLDLTRLDELQRELELHLDRIGEETASLMLEYALAGRNIVGLKQIYGLVPFCRFHVWQAGSLAEEAVRGRKPELLADEGGAARRETLPAHLTTLQQTLRTLTSSDPPIAEQASHMLEDIPSFLAIVRDVERGIRSLVADRRKYDEGRDAVLVSLSRLDSQTVDSIFQVKARARERLNNATTTIYVTVVVVAVTSVLGWLLVWKIGRHMDEVTNKALAARKTIEERTVQLAAANRELDSFAYSVSHDLRAPLRGIDGFSLALLEDYFDRLDEEGRDYLGRIRAGCQRMGRLIDDILKLSRLARTEMRREPVDLSTMAASIAEELHRSDLSRKVDFGIPSGIVADGDAELLRVVMDNLLGNAWKFTGKTRDARIEFGVRKEEEVPVYYVRDNGAGYNADFAEKLFGAFQRLHSESEFEGTGVGLATVQRVIHRHGGEVWSEGAVGKGATFYFTL
jgi:signal transduction histidine kinase